MKWGLSSDATSDDENGQSGYQNPLLKENLRFSHIDRVYLSENITITQFTTTMLL
jgi:hypothetical protein